MDEAEAPRRVGQIEVGQVEVRIRAFEYDHPQARRRVHSREQILERCEHAGAQDVERRAIEHDPPVRGRFLDDAQRRRWCSHSARSFANIAASTLPPSRFASSAEKRSTALNGRGYRRMLSIRPASFRVTIGGTPNRAPEGVPETFPRTITRFPETSTSLMSNFMSGIDLAKFATTFID